MNGKSPMISHAPPFVMRLSKDERKVFQQNHNLNTLSETAGAGERGAFKSFEATHKFKRFKSFNPSNVFNRYSREFVPRRSAGPGLFPNSLQVARLLQLVHETQIDKVAGLGLRRLGRILADFFQRRLNRFGAHVEAAVHDRPFHLIGQLQVLVDRASGVPADAARVASCITTMCDCKTWPHS